MIQISNLDLPNQDIFWMSLFILQEVGSDHVCLINQACSVFQNILIESFSNGVVRVDSLTNDEVEKDDARENDHDKPHEPEDVVVEWAQILYAGNDTVVTDRDSQNN